MRVGIIGGGHIAAIHGSIITQQPGAEIAAIADKNLAQARSLAGKLNVLHVYQDAEDMLAQQKLDLVHVLTPPQFHADLSIMAMDHGCHVLVEKPMALNIADAQRMLEAARRNQVYLCANHNMIFEGAVQRARELIGQGMLGEIISVESSYQFNPGRYQAILQEGAQFTHWTYRLNGGPLQDLMPHPASLVMAFLPEIQEVHHIGQNRGRLPAGWQDELRVIIKSSGPTGYISLSMNERPDMVTLVIKGTEGSLSANLFNDILTVQRKSALPRAVARGLSGFDLVAQNFSGSVGNIYKFATKKLDKTSGLSDVIKRLYAAIRVNDPPPIPVDMGFRVVELIDKIWPEPMVTPEALTPPKVIKRHSLEPSVLVTGASGFIGTHLLKCLLAAEKGVRVLVRPNSSHAGRLRNLDIDVVEGDLSDAQKVCEAMRGIQTVFHAGATLSNDWAEHERTNVQGTRYMLEAAQEHDVERFLYVSTLAVYGLEKIHRNMLIREEASYLSDPKSMGAYYYSKAEAEKLVLAAHRNQGLPITIVRPGLVIGPHGRIFFQQLGYQYKDSLFVIIGPGNNILPLTYVENTVDAMITAAGDERAIGKIYNLIDEGNITAREYVDRFIKATGIKARVVHVPYLLPYAATTAYEAGVAMGALKKGVTSRSQLRWKQAPVIFDGSRIRNELGWKQPISTDEGLTCTFSWYAQQRKING
jgi:2-alkyl-3-oxoalkanoate reductase